MPQADWGRSVICPFCRANSFYQRHDDNARLSPRDPVFAFCHNKQDYWVNSVDTNPLNKRFELHSSGELLFQQNNRCRLRLSTRFKLDEVNARGDFYSAAIATIPRYSILTPCFQLVHEDLHQATCHIIHSEIYLSRGGNRICDGRHRRERVRVVLGQAVCQQWLCRNPGEWRWCTRDGIMIRPKNAVLVSFIQAAGKSVRIAAHLIACVVCLDPDVGAGRCQLELCFRH